MLRASQLEGGSPERRSASARHTIVVHGNPRVIEGADGRLHFRTRCNGRIERCRRRLGLSHGVRTLVIRNLPGYLSPRARPWSSSFHSLDVLQQVLDSGVSVFLSTFQSNCRSKHGCGKLSTVRMSCAPPGVMAVLRQSSRRAARKISVRSIASVTSTCSSTGRCWRTETPESSTCCSTSTNGTISSAGRPVHGDSNTR